MSAKCILEFDLIPMKKDTLQTIAERTGFSKADRLLEVHRIARGFRAGPALQDKRGRHIENTGRDPGMRVHPGPYCTGPQDEAD